MKYTSTKEGWNRKILSYNQVKEYINLVYPGTILPHDITNPTILEYFEIKELKEIYPEVKEDLKPYYDYTSGEPFQDSLGNWCIEWKGYINERKLNNAWDDIRLKRDKLLLDTDWMEQSNILTEDCKLKYKIYRQLLRDTLNIVDYPHEVIFPLTPKLSYIDSLNLYKNNTNTDQWLTKMELENIKNFTPTNEELDNWNVFLKEWSKIKFNNNKQYVKNLITLHTNINYETIF